MAGPLLVAYDGSDPSKLALEFAAERAAQLKRPVLLVTVVPPQAAEASFSAIFLPTIEVARATGRSSTYEDTARRNLEAVAADVKKRGVAVDAQVRTGDAADEILLAADEADAEQIVLGFKSYEKRLLFGLGSTADKILRYATRTVTVVRPPPGK